MGVRRVLGPEVWALGIYWGFPRLGGTVEFGGSNTKDYSIWSPYFGIYGFTLARVERVSWVRKGVSRHSNSGRSNERCRQDLSFTTIVVIEDAEGPRKGMASRKVGGSSS